MIEYQKYPKNIPRSNEPVLTTIIRHDTGEVIYLVLKHNDSWKTIYNKEIDMNFKVIAWSYFEKPAIVDFL